MLIPASLLLAGVALPLPLAAQEVVQPLPGTTDADKLADLVRELGRNPRDLSALIDAGDLSAKLGDSTAAAALFKRASQVDPNNARVKAGIARILVNGEHPGEALRYFEQAERSGLAPVMFADDRGLAYDLIGEQERAQRDYRLALARTGRDNEDEVRRRYALSLGISGRKDEALQQIDALLRKSDRGAWRARAFILAMNGDASGANRIATTMMPAGMATGLAAFFTRLPTLSPTDRAFAVHFGEVTPTPERLADARLVPSLPALAPDAYSRSAAVQVAAQTVAPPQNMRDRRRGREPRQVAQPNTAVAARQSTQRQASGVTTQPTPSSVAPTQLAQRSTFATPSSVGPAAPTVVAAASPSAIADPVSTVSSAPSAPSPASTQRTPSSVAPTQLAQRSAFATPGYARAVGPTAAAVASPSAAADPASTVNSAGSTRSLAPATLAAAGSVASTTPARPTAAANLAIAAETSTIVPSATTPVMPGAIAPVVLAATTPAASAAPTSAADANNVVRAQTVGATGTTQVTNVATSPSAAPSSVQLAAITPAPAPAAPPRAESEDTILARIVANISIPASELGVAPMPSAAPPAGAITTLDEAAVAAERNAAAVQRRREVAEAEQVARSTAPARARRTAAQTVVAKAASVSRRRGAPAEAATDETPANKTRRRGTAKEQLAETVEDAATPRRGVRAPGEKAAAEVVTTDTKKPTSKQAAAKARADAKELAKRGAAAEEKKAARADPERYWIQVAGGASDGDLRKAWSSTKAKSSLLAGRTGYSTPLRATNRVVTGPFKTEAEAQAMVNKLSKQGVSAFTFTSAPGQKMTKLGDK